MKEYAGFLGMVVGIVITQVIPNIYLMKEMEKQRKERDVKYMETIRMLDEAEKKYSRRF
jgi:hypothetical protein